MNWTNKFSNVNYIHTSTLSIAVSLDGVGKKWNNV